MIELLPILPNKLFNTKNNFTKNKSYYCIKYIKEKLYDHPDYKFYLNKIYKLSELNGYNINYDFERKE